MKTLYIDTAWRKRDWLTTRVILIRMGILIHANLKSNSISQDKNNKIMYSSWYIDLNINEWKYKIIKP